MPAVDGRGHIVVWHGDAPLAAGSAWFDATEPAATVGADQIWNVHYSRFIESGPDVGHVPFVHGVYTPGLGQPLTEVKSSTMGIASRCRRSWPTRNRGDR